VSDQTALGAERLKHLEFIQAGITRFGGNSFLIKGWALTIGAAFFAVLVNKLSSGIAVAGLVPLVAFWFLDGMYLWYERLFRKLYDDVRTPGTTVELLSMDTGPYENTVTWAKAAFSITPLLFYGALIAVDVAFLVIALAHHR
jgi:hypothetical protein